MVVNLIKRWQPTPKSIRWEDYFHGREELLWASAPLEKLQFHWGMLGLSIFGLPFLVAGIVIVALGLLEIFSFSGWQSFGSGLLQTVFGLPFLGVGFAITIGTWMAASMRPHFIRYAISNKRAYIATSWWSHKMESYPITPDSQIELQQGKNSDSVYFFDSNERDSDGDRISKRIGFEHIADGGTVYAMLRDIQQEATS